MTRTIVKRKSPRPRKTRTNRDWVMIMIGIGLIIFFLVAGYVGIGERGKGPVQKKRGPVKNPKALGQMWDRESRGFGLLRRICRQTVV